MSAPLGIVIHFPANDACRNCQDEAEMHRERAQSADFGCAGVLHLSRVPLAYLHLRAERREKHACRAHGGSEDADAGGVWR